MQKRVKPSLASHDVPCVMDLGPFTMFDMPSKPWYESKKIDTKKTDRPNVVNS